MTPAGTSASAPTEQLLYDLELRFPPLSRTVTEISALLSNKAEVPSTDRLIEIIQMDPVVVSSVLRRINSAYYGLNRRFDDIGKAVVMMGFLEVSNIVLTSGFVGIRRAIASKSQAAVLDHLFRLSVGSGFFMRLIASRVHVSHTATAYTTGLLHSVGRLVLLYNHPDAYVELWQSDRPRFAPTAEEERRHIGIDHLTLGGIAAEHWKLPEPIGSLIEAYGSPGLLAEHQLRNLALSLKLSVELTEQLCTFRERVPPIYGEKAPEAPVFDPIASGFSFDYPPEVEILAQSSNLDVDDLRALLDSNQRDAIHYIESMTQG